MTNENAPENLMWGFSIQWHNFCRSNAIISFSCSDDTLELFCFLFWHIYKSNPLLRKIRFSNINWEFLLESYALKVSLVLSYSEICFHLIGQKYPV